MNDITRLTEMCQKIGITLNKRQECQFQKYYDLLIEWNEKVNLTAITEFDDVCSKHFLDSLSLVYVYKNQKCRLIDIGTGAGFPGIPLKICYPDWNVTLLDSLQKRLTFLDTVINELELTDIRTVHGRAEDFGHDKKYREQYDVCVSRAVANLSVLTELCMPYVKKDGFFISYKSEKGQEELAGAKKAIHVLGGEVAESKEFMLPGTDYTRDLIVIKKNKVSPNIYPRKAGTPAKEPIK